jgi:hypothetical protein
MQLPDSLPPQPLPPELGWRRIKVGPTLGTSYILAGKPFGVSTHHPRHATWPCLRRLPGCTLPCPWCKFQLRYTSYVPLIDFHARKLHRVVVLGGKRTWESLEGVEPGRMVMLSRGDGETDTILFREVEDDPMYKLHLLKWRRVIPLEIRPYVFHLWQLRDVSRFYGINFHASNNTLEKEEALRRFQQEAQPLGDLQREHDQIE